MGEQGLFSLEKIFLVPLWPLQSLLDHFRHEKLYLSTFLHYSLIKRRLKTPDSKALHKTVIFKAIGIYVQCISLWFFYFEQDFSSTHSAIMEFLFIAKQHEVRKFILMKMSAIFLFDKNVFRPSVYKLFFPLFRGAFRTG